MGRKGGAKPNTRGEIDPSGGLARQLETMGVSDEATDLMDMFLDPAGMTRGPGSIDFQAEGFQVDPTTGTVQGLEDWMGGQQGLSQTAGNLAQGQRERIRTMQEAGPATAQGAGVESIVPQYGHSRQALHEAQNLGARQMQQAAGLSSLAGQFGQQALGKGPMSPEELQLRQQSARNMAAQNAMAAGARGGASGAALYNAANQSAQIGAQTNADAMQQRARAVQQARENQMAAHKMSGELVGQARGHGMEAAGLYSDQEQFGAGLQHQAAMAEAGYGMDAILANQAATNRLGEFTEGQQGQYDQALFGNLAGVQGQTLQGLGLQEDAWLGGEEIRKEAFEAPMGIEAGLATAEYQAQAESDKGVLGMVGGLFGL